jgi:membrane-bound lytic murein transglycosylase D
MAARETLSPMATGSARRAAAAAGWVLWSAASAAYGAEPRPAPAEASARGPSTSPGQKSSSKPVRAGDANARRTIAGGPTGDDVLPGAESADLRALREAELELFPAPSSSARANHWPSEGQLPSPGEGPHVVATGLPPGPSHPAAEANRIDVSWLEPLEMPDLPVRWDERVVRYLKFFRDDPYGRTTFANLYRHSGRWREMIRRALRRRSLPDDLAWVCMIESGFDATARSSAGAIGLWQLMPETAKIYGLTIDHWVDQRLSPSLATQAAVTLLDDLHRRFGSWELALAGFNMGHAGLASVVRRYNTNDFWSLAHTEGTLPWETTLYVPKILAAAVISHNLAAFGFGDLLVEGAVETDDVEVAPATSLAAIAQAASCSLHEIEALNPELRASRTPPADGGDAAAYTVHVPQGKGAAAAQALARLRKDQPALERYTVRFGETLDQVATARRTTSQKLVELNAIVPGEVLRGGTVLLVPGLTGGETAPVAPSSPKTSVVVPSDVFVYPDRERVFYRVIALDTLKDIAAAIHVSQDDLRRWNDLDAAARLQEGMTLQAFVAPVTDLSGVVVVREKDARVLPVGSDEFFAVLEQEKGFRRTTVSAKAGETVESIGKHFSVPPRTMERINRRSRNDTLKPGEAVVVYVPCKAPCAARAATASSEPVVVGARPSQPTD